MASSSVSAASRAAKFAVEMLFTPPLVRCMAPTPTGWRWPQRAPAQYAPKVINAAARRSLLMLEVRLAVMVEVLCRELGTSIGKICEQFMRSRARLSIGRRFCIEVLHLSLSDRFSMTSATSDDGGSRPELRPGRAVLLVWRSSQFFRSRRQAFLRRTSARLCGGAHRLRRSRARGGARVAARAGTR